MRSVAQVEGLRSALEYEPFRELKVAVEACVHVDHAGPAQGVPTHCAKPHVSYGEERRGIEQCAAWIRTITAGIVKRTNLVRCLLVVRHIQGGIGSSQCVPSPHEGAEDTVDLPPTQDRLRSATSLGILLASAEGEFVHIAKLEVVGDIVLCSSTVATPRQIRGPDGFGPIRVRCHVNGMRVGICAFKKQAARDAPVDADLQRVVGASQRAIIYPGGCRASESGVEQLPIKAGAGYLPGVDVAEREVSDRS